MTDASADGFTSHNESIEKYEREGKNKEETMP